MLSLPETPFSLNTLERADLTSLLNFGEPPGKDTPISRPIQSAAMGRIVEIPQGGGLHYRYERVAT